jgi:uncharacterized membrane protein
MTHKWFPLIFIAAMLVFSLAVYNQLPDIVPTHWNIAGEPDGFSGKLEAVLFAPALSLALLILLNLLPRIDPRRAAYEDFQTVYRFIVNSIMAFMLFIHVLTLGAGLGWQVEIGRAVSAGVGVLFVLMGEVMPRVRRNYFVGVRTPWTLSSDEVWRKTHRFSGKLFMLLGLLMIVAAALLPEMAIFVVVMAGALVSVVGMLAYSYWVWRKTSPPNPLSTS